jgi:lysophospholipase L1-like esterase
MSSLKGIFRRSVVLVLLVAALFVGSIVTTHTLSIATPAHAAAVVGSIQDPNIAYIGRWDKTSSTTMYKSYWPATYLKTSFTGKTVKIKLAVAVNIYVSIDGKADVLYVSAKGTFNLTPTPLAAGTHTLRVAVRSGNIEFEGLVLDAGAKTVAPRIASRLIEFTGDSITAGYTDTNTALSDYAWLVGEQLHVEHTQIAQSGICLVAQSGCYGMDTQYFKLGGIHDINTPNWDFSRYQASAVVINLGTNDNGHGVTKATFQAAYTTFMRNIRAKYPHAAIFAFETLRQVYVPETQAAVKTLNAAGDSNVYFVNTVGWIGAGDYSADGGHPNDQGQMKIAAKLAPIIAKVLGIPAN